MMVAVTVRVRVGKRAYGTGSLRQKHGAWYGSWRTPDARRTTRKLGPVRTGRDGLSKTQAEGKLREIASTAGFADVRKLAIDDAFNDLYALTA